MGAVRLQKTAVRVMYSPNKDQGKILLEKVQLIKIKLNYLSSRRYSTRNLGKSDNSLK